MNGTITDCAPRAPALTDTIPLALSRSASARMAVRTEPSGPITTRSARNRASTSVRVGFQQPRPEPAFGIAMRVASEMHDREARPVQRHLGCQRPEHERRDPENHAVAGAQRLFDPAGLLDPGPWPPVGKAPATQGMELRKGPIGEIALQDRLDRRA